MTVGTIKEAGMKTTERASRRRLVPCLMALGLLTVALAAPGAAAAAGGDVLWSVPWAGLGYDDAVAIPVGPSGSALMCSTVTAGITPTALVQRKAVAGPIDWTAVWGNDIDGGLRVHEAVCDAADRSVYLVTRVDDIIHGQAVAIAKLDAAGTLVWTRTWSATSSAGPTVTGAAVDRRGNLYVTGVTWSPPTAAVEAFLIKLSARGALLWERNWWKGSWEGGVEGLAVSPGGRAYCVGERVTGLGDTWRSFVRAVTPSGRTDWTQTFGGSASRPAPKAVALAPDGSVVVAGRGDAGGVVKGIAEKYGANGRRAWRRTVSTGDVGDGFLSVAVAPSGRVYAGGASGFSAAGEAGPYVVALRPSGLVAWRSQWNQEGWGQQIVVAGTQVYVGASLVEGPADNKVVGVECLNNANGSTTWRQMYDAGAGAGASVINDLTVVPGQSLYLAAEITDEVTGHDGWFLRLQP
jgi:hypothetical protein